MKMEQTECSEKSAYKIQTPGNYPEESILHKEQGESLKSRILPALVLFKTAVYSTLLPSNQVCGHPSPVQRIQKALSPGINRAEDGDDHSEPSTDMSKNGSRVTAKKLARVQYCAVLRCRENVTLYGWI
jgi:hypothetical protein